MKRMSIQKVSAAYIRQLVWIAGLFFLTLSPAVLQAQTDTAQQAPAAAEPELLSPGLDIIAVQKMDNTIDLKVAMKTKYNGTFYKLYALKVDFVQVTDSAENPLGSVVTNRDGKCLLTVDATKLKTDAEGKIHFKASFAGKNGKKIGLDVAEGEVTITRGRLEITPVKEDSLLTVKVKLISVGNGVDTPVKETVVGIYVKRSFSALKIGEGTTDESGEAVVEIPQNLPGDDKGNIILMAKLDESEQFGNLEASVAQPWGSKTSFAIQEAPRALWSSHPPMWMLITFIVLMVVVWGHYIIIVYEMFRLKKEDPKEKASNATIS